MSLKFKKYKVLVICALLVLFAAKASFANIKTCNDCAYNKNIFNYFTYQDLAELSKTAEPKGNLKEKLDHVFWTPVVDNTLNCGKRKKLQNDRKIGNFIRVASWNIGRGMQADSIKKVFSSPELLLKTAIVKNTEELEVIKKQMEIIRNADIITLSEVDAGMPRTGYRNIIEELSKTLGYNYAYAVEFIEIDPAHLGLEDYKWSEERFLFEKGILKDTEIDKNKFKGLHGSAILSRFPLDNVRILRLPKCYDWFNSENKRITELETVKRNVAEKVFRAEMIREIRHGERIALIADINLPEVNKTITVTAIHLENRSMPKCRKLQLETVLKFIKNIKNPVILAGDFNTTGVDGSPTSVKKEIGMRLKDPNFVVRTVILYGNPLGLAINAISYTTGFFMRYTDPTVVNVPIFAPNSERGFFNTLEDFEFKDDLSFDFRGQKEKSVNGKEGKLANSNERDFKGFKPTFLFERPLGIGKYKLDWIFVKGYPKESDNQGSNNFAPHYGRTLLEMNYAFEHALSDHAPIIVDLPVK